MKFLDPKTGWKTYAVCVVGIGAGVAQAMGYHIPGWVDWTLVFLGGAALRHGVQNQSAALAATVLDAIVQPPSAPVGYVEKAPLPPVP